MVSEITKNPSPDFEHDDREYFVKSCGSCGWWYSLEKWHSLTVPPGPEDEIGSKLFEGIVRRFDLSGLEVPMNVLRRYLAAHRYDVAHLNPKKFDLLIQDIYQDFYGGEVRH